MSIDRPNSSGESTEQSLLVDGETRTYQLYEPSTVGEEAPLLIALHGGLGWGTQFETASGLDAIAEANGFVVVYPNGTGVALRDRSRVWNAGYCCGKAEDSRDAIDDVAFLAAVVADVIARYDIDPSRVFVTGHSNGAMMAYRFACERSDLVAAIAVQSGPLFAESCPLDRPMSLLHIHGSVDQNVPIDGGVGPDSLVGKAFPPALTGPTLFAERDHCGDPSTAADPTRVVTRWAGCSEGIEIEFVEVIGASHSWMTATTGGDSTIDFDSSEAIWAFLARQSR